jgi:hypothetical protein
MTTHELTDAEKIGLAAVPAEDREAEAEKLEQEAVLAVTPDEEARVAEEAVPGGPPSAKELAAEQKEPAEVAEASNAEAERVAEEAVGMTEPAKAPAKKAPAKRAPAKK